MASRKLSVQISVYTFYPLSYAEPPDYLLDCIVISMEGIALYHEILQCQRRTMAYIIGLGINANCLNLVTTCGLEVRLQRMTKGPLS